VGHLGVIVDGSWEREVDLACPRVRGAVLDAIDLAHVYGLVVTREAWEARRAWQGYAPASDRRAWERLTARLRRIGAGSRLDGDEPGLDLRPDAEWLRYAGAALDEWLLARPVEAAA
jgi:hypothetical protein